MSRCSASVIIVCGVSLFWAMPAQAAVKTWATAVTGSWTGASNWTGGVPTATDSAAFNKAGTYTVTFSNVFQDLNSMTFSAGTVTFERVTSPATLTIQNASGPDTLTITGATLNMGNTLPVNISPGGNTIINSGGALNVRAGSLLHNTATSNPLSLVTVNPGGALAVSGGGQVLNDGLGFVFGDTPGPNATVTVTGAGSTLTGTLAVGGIQVRNAVFTLQSGGKAFGGDDAIGYGPDSAGTATISGAGSTWNGSDLMIGERGAATLRIENGGAAIFSSSGVIASTSTSTASVTVTGPLSSWTVGSLAVGDQGSATLNIFDGAVVKVGNAAGPVSINSLSTLNIGEGAAAGILQAGSLANNGVLNFDHTDAAIISAPISGSGQITKVDGAGDTTLANVSAFTGSFSAQGGLMHLQGNANGSNYTAAGNGTLRFSSGTVNLGIGFIVAAATGVVEYDSANVRGGFLRGPGTHTIIPGAGVTTFNAVTTYNSTNIVQNGSAFLLNFTNGGVFTSNAPLTFSGGVNTATGVINVNSTLNTFDVGNSGVLTVNSGGVVNNQIANLVNGGGSRTTISSGGAINLLDGTALELNGALLVNNGTVTGTVNVNYGSLAKGTGAYDVVNVNEGGVYSPGNSPGISTATTLVFQNGSFTSGAPRLVMELGGMAPGTQYDQLHVSGALTLNGTLDVRLVDAGAGLFAPSAGNSFDILDWGTLSGTFSSIQLPTLAGGLAWNTSQLYSAGVLSVGLPGDFSGNGVVDAADYVVWRKGLGTIYTQNDYNVWRANFGAPLGSGSGAEASPSPAAVPEPSSALLLLGFVIVGFSVQGRSRRCGHRPESVTSKEHLPCIA